MPMKLMDAETIELRHLDCEEEHVKENKSDETNCVSLEIPGNYKLLSDPGIWIADTGATVHNTPYRIGISELRRGNTLDSVIV